jgi:two-component system LytT family response regulator
LRNRHSISSNRTAPRGAVRLKQTSAEIVIKRGREISNEEIYNTIWEERAGGGDRMNVYYNALHRLRRVLKNAGDGNMLIATQRGQMVDVDCFTCDYYEWLDGNADVSKKFAGEFLSEYSWSEAYLADMLRHEDDPEHAL